MVDDILLSPEEQDEKAKQWLKDNGLALIVGVALGLGAVFGYNTYTAKQIANAEQASTLYNQALESIKASELADIEEPVATLKGEFPGTPYASKAALLRAKQLSVSDLSAASNELQWVIDNAKEFGVKHTARVRRAKIEVALGNLESAKSLATIDSAEGFGSYYQEILGDIAMAEGQEALARDYYQQSLDNLGASDAAYRSVLNLKLNRIPAAKIPAAITDSAAASDTDSDAE